MVNKSKLLDEIDILNRQYWKQMELVKDRFKLKMKAINMWKGAKAKLSEMENKMIKLREEYNN